VRDKPWRSSPLSSLAPAHPLSVKATPIINNRRAMKEITSTTKVEIFL